MTLPSLILATLLASLFGSLHCAGMCGAFVMLAVGGPIHPRRLLSPQLAYHAGRFVSYTTLGALAGAAGSLLNLTSTLAGLRPIAASLAGATIAAFGILTLLRLLNLRIAKLALPQSWTTLISRATRYTLNYPPHVRAFAIGLFTTLLPCGWLYAFAITAAGTAHPLTGALVMSSFWLGTVPALATLGVATRRLLDPLNKRIPALTAIFLIAFGLYTLTARASLNPITLVNRSTHPSPREGRGGVRGETSSNQQPSLLPTTRPACCTP